MIYVNPSVLSNARVLVLFLVLAYRAEVFWRVLVRFHGPNRLSDLATWHVYTNLPTHFVHMISLGVHRFGSGDCLLTWFQ